MSETFLGEIRSFSFGFVPKYWAECNGQLLPIAQNQALFSLLGTQFGGNGQTTFALPDLRNRASVGQSSRRSVGASGGAETHTLTTNELPTHTHTARAGGAATTADPSGATWATTKKASYAASPNTAMAVGATGSSGGSQAHENMPPHLAVVFAISLNGIYPSRG
jgi:microcystin-dependent protein